MLTGRLEEKNYEDLIGFLQVGLREGIRLDYKEDFPRNLEKTISAMANTEGGLVLVGVAELADRPGFPNPEPVGVPTAQAVERVVEKCYQAIREPLFPNVHAIQLPSDSSKCVVAIRITPSERAPHAIEEGAGVYVRVDSQSLPAGGEPRMALDRVAWLLRRREDNERLLQRAIERAEELLPRTQSPGHAYLRITVRPALAHADPLPMAELRRLAQRVSRNRWWQFPDNNMRSVAGGLIGINEPREMYIDVTGLSVYSRQIPIASELKVHPPGENVFVAAWLPDSVLHLRWAATSAVEAGRGGTLRIQAELRGIRGAALKVGDNMFFMADRHRALQDVISAEVDVSADDLVEDATAAAIALLRQFADAFDYDHTEAGLRQFYRDAVD